MVLDPFPPRRGRRTPQRLAQLYPLEAGVPAEALRGLLGVAPGWTDQPAFMRAHNVLQADRAGLISAVSAVAAGGLSVQADHVAAPRLARATPSTQTQRKPRPSEPWLEIDAAALRHNVKTIARNFMNASRRGTLAARARIVVLFFVRFSR